MRISIRNSLLRMVAVSLILTLVTSSIASQTYAKYVTTAQGSDETRVAKWGVNIQINDEQLLLFKAEYSDEENESEIIAQATNKSDYIVAPGRFGYMTMKITGTPEVATNISINLTDLTGKLEAKSPNLSAGSYMVLNDLGVDYFYTINETYEPIKWYLGTSEPTQDSDFTMTLLELKTALAEIGGEVVPNTLLDKKYYIGWLWPFVQDVAGTWSPNRPALIDQYKDIFNVDYYTGDFLDSYLGKESPLQTLSFGIIVKVEQIEDY